MKRAALFSAALAVASVSSDRAALAADGAPPGDDWKFVVAPYVWGSALEGRAVVQGNEASIDLSASDIFDHLEIGFMAMMVARKRDWGITGDVIYVALGATSDTPPADIDPTLQIVGVSGVRRLSDWADVTFGARWNRVEGEIHFKPPMNLDVGRTRDWVDPIVGVVLRTPGRGRWQAALIADVGGFGVGSDSTWQVFPTVGFDLTKSKSVSMELGWRLLDVDYDNDDESDPFEYDVRYQGPVAGLAIRF